MPYRDFPVFLSTGFHSQVYIMGHKNPSYGKKGNPLNSSAVKDFLRFTRNMINNSPIRNNKIRFIDIGDYAVMNREGHGMATYGLGSCIAIVITHPATKTIAMAHSVLPSSINHPDKAKDKPGYYVDSAIKAILQEFYKKINITDHTKELKALITGAANSIYKENFFKIGKRNTDMAKKLLRHYNIPLIRNEIGGVKGRNVKAFINTGEVVINASNHKIYINMY